MYDVVIIGSGYAGSAMAARLAGHGAVLMLERGRAWRPGDFPTSLRGIAATYRTEKNPLGLWEMRLGAGTGNAAVSALGGASIVNYGITVRPDDHVFASWPLPKHEIDRYLERALEVLAPSPSPVADELGDKTFLDRVEPGRRKDIHNTIDWERCINCGHCVPGCNYDAKRSLDKTYQPIATSRGCEIRCRAEVVRLEPCDGGWVVVARDTEGREALERIPTRRVVLACGTFGTLDLLARHRDRLDLSPAFGEHMSMNGDGVAFLYNTGHRLSGHHGAPITTSARLRMTDPTGRPRTLTIMSGRIPASLIGTAASIMAASGSALGRRAGPGDDGTAAERARRRMADLAGVRPGGALSQTFMYKLDGEDGAAGRARFDEKGRSAIDWPEYQNDPINRFAAERLEAWTAQVGATIIPNLGTLPGMKSFGVHPLGGCRMGRSFEEGVVDDTGRVHRKDGGFVPHLRVVDASIFPSSLGVPPSLTVAALAERAADAIARDMASSG